jgi:hypothetical protein
MRLLAALTVLFGVAPLPVLPYVGLVPGRSVKCLGRNSHASAT